MIDHEKNVRKARSKQMVEAVKEHDRQKRATEALEEIANRRQRHDKD
jgi:phosphopantothenate synthetase